jgi:hypothetical protein
MPCEDKAIPCEDEAMPCEGKAMPCEDEAVPCEDKVMPCEDKAMPLPVHCYLGVAFITSPPADSPPAIQYALVSWYLARCASRMLPVR